MKNKMETFHVGERVYIKHVFGKELCGDERDDAPVVLHGEVKGIDAKKKVLLVKLDYGKKYKVPVERVFHDLSKTKKVVKHVEDVMKEHDNTDWFS